MGMSASRCSSVEALSEIARLGRIFSCPSRSMPGTMPLVESVTCRGRKPDALGIEQDPHRGHRRVVIEQRFALAHQHDIGLRRKLLAIFLQRDQHLPDDFARREIADQAQLRGQAKMAIHGAARLRRNANRLAAFPGHEDGFDLRGLRIVRRFGPPIENRYRIDPSTDGNRRTMRGSVMRASSASRARKAAGRFVMAAKSNRRSA